MTHALGRLTAYAESYVESAQSCRNAWDGVCEDHDTAMMVRDIEDAIKIGVAVIGVCINRIEAWHNWVSRDATRYEAAVHDVVETTQRNLLDACSEIIEVIDGVKQHEYEVDGELGFRECFRELRMRSGALLDTPQPSDSVLDACKQATRDYASGKLEESCENPWDVG